MKVFAVSLFQGAKECVFTNMQEAVDFLMEEIENGDSLEPDDQSAILVKEMTKEEIDNLPEWDGP